MTVGESTRPQGGTAALQGVHPATFVAVVGANDTYWRVDAPAKAIGAKVIKVRQEEFVDVFTAPNTESVFPWTMTALLANGDQVPIRSRGDWEQLFEAGTRYLQLDTEFPAVEGTVIHTRPNLAQGVLARAMRLKGMRTIAETDDNYFSPSHWNLHLRHMEWNDEHRDAHAKVFASHGECVFSTADLRDRYYREFRERFGKQLIPNLHVCSNHVPQSDWPERVERDGPLRVGFMGSVSHVWDVNLTYAAFHVAHETGCETVMIGYNPAAPDNDIPNQVMVDGELVSIRSEKSRNYMDKWGEVVSKHIPWIDPALYHRAALPLDIGLCPLRVDEFNMSKSDVKAIEYTISGAAVVCSNTPVYNRYWKHEETCLMANSVEEMALATHRLIKDPKLRYELVSNAQQYVAENRGLQQLKDEWGAVLAA